MISEQLQAARATHWRQNQSPLLTLDDAMGWVHQHPLCLYLPRPGQLPAPAPSFVEACSGSREATPGAEALEHAQALLVRLTASHTVVPLNLFGTVSEQPDFLVHIDALPFVLSLRAESDWKRPPQKSAGHAVSPLVLELWKAIEKDGSLSASDARQALGRELTEAAVLRGLCALWQALRLSPVYAEEGGPARWEMLRVHHRAALETAAGTGQVTALSLLVSMYLQSVYAASSEEIEIFLSPLASRARVREAVRGLAATRQIHSLSMDAQTYYFLEGGLPEFPEVAATAPGAELMSTPTEPSQPRPVGRRVPRTPPRLPASPAQEPLFRRPKPPAAAERSPAALPVRPPSRPENRPAASMRPAPAGRTAWKSAPRPAGPARSDGRAGAPAKKPGAPPASFAPRRPFPPRDARSPQGPPRPSRPAYARPGPPAKRAAGPSQPPEKRAARPGKWDGGEKRVGGWKGSPRRDAPRSWAAPNRTLDRASDRTLNRKPDRKPAAADGRRPPSARRDAPFRPRDPGKFQRPAETPRERPEGRANRPQRGPFPGRGNQSAAPYARPTARPGAKVDGHGPQRRPGKPATSPAAGKGAPGERPRFPARNSFSAKPRSGQTQDRAGNRGPRPPFQPGSASRKPGKPSPKYGGPKPDWKKTDRKKPGA